MQVVVLDGLRDAVRRELLDELREAGCEAFQTGVIGSLEREIAGREILVQRWEALEAAVGDVMGKVVGSVRRFADLQLRIARQHRVPGFRWVSVEADRRTGIAHQEPRARLVMCHHLGDAVRPACAELRGETRLEELHASGRLEPERAVRCGHAERSRPRTILLDLDSARRLDVHADPFFGLHRIESMAKIAVVGSYGVGLTVELDRVPEAGETVVGRSFRTDHGGKGSNQAVGAVRLGAEVDFLTAIGDDAFGHEAIALWEAEGVRAEPVVVNAPTMTAPILVEPSGENRIIIVPGALAELGRVHVDAFAGRIAAADICVVQLEIPVDTALYALELARRAGARTILNPAPAPPSPIAPEVDYVTPNETEAAAVRDAD